MPPLSMGIALAENIDLGNGFHMRYFGWYPNGDINPQFAGMQEISKAGVTIFKDGECVAACTFDTPETQKVFPKHNRWTVVQENPLTLQPSILNPTTGLHGFITNGKWVGCL